MAVTLVTGMSTGFGLFFRLLYVLGLATVLSFVWNWISLERLEVQVERRSRRVRVGDTVEERITVRNLGILPKPTLEVEDLTDLPGYSSGMATSLAGKSFRSWRTQVPARKRGVYSLGPVRVANTDAFGLFRREKLFCGIDSLIVYPRAYPVPGFTIPAANLSGDSTARKRTHDLTPHASSVREYAFGDSLSRVHWNSTARLGKLMSKQFDLGISSDLWLVVDLHRDVQAGQLDESTDEYAVSIAASVARKYLEAQTPVGLIAYGDKRYFLPADTGAGQFDRIMESLAMSKADGQTPLDALLAREEGLWGFNTSLVVITPSHHPEWVTALGALNKRRVRIATIVLENASFGGLFNTLEVVPALYDAGLAPYVIRQSDNIPVSLSRVYVLPGAEGVEQLERTEARL
ncbi:MAG: DUF58 domain-containing protein [Chloroflexi bacterium]|nr:DUF58 domain-containing protein [Chloroflexota bacterium]